MTITTATSTDGTSSGDVSYSVDASAGAAGTGSANADSSNSFTYTFVSNTPFVLTLNGSFTSSGQGASVSSSIQIKSSSNDHITKTNFDGDDTEYLYAGTYTLIVGTQASADSGSASANGSVQWSTKPIPLIVTNSNADGPGSFNWMLGAVDRDPPENGPEKLTIAPSLQGTTITLTAPIVYALNRDQVQISGPITLDGSSISDGHANFGLFILSSHDTVSGLTIKGFSGEGILFFGSADTAQGCTITDNADGILVNGTADTVQGCTITGNQALGIYVTGSSNTIGGITSNAGNLLSGNGVGLGMYEFLGQGGSNIVQGNLIGTDSTGTAALPNRLGGIYVDGTSGNTIGGTIAGAANVISGNKGCGILLANDTATNFVGMANANIIEGNFIGTDVTGAKHLGNTAEGILLTDGASGNTIGLAAGDTGSSLAQAQAAGNTIAFNGVAAVWVTGNSTTGNSIRSNSIYDNGASPTQADEASYNSGIDLGGDGWTQNGSQATGAAGPNSWQQYPVSTIVRQNSTRAEIKGTLNGTPITQYTIDFYADPSSSLQDIRQGKTYLGSVQCTTNSAGVATFDETLPNTVGLGFSATATGPDGTSEIEVCSPPIMKCDGPASDTRGGVTVGEPITVSTGNVYQSIVDYTTAGPNPLSFTRYYNSLAASDSAAVTLGQQWRSTFDRYLHLDSATSVTAERETGQILNFTLVSGVWMTDTDEDFTLTHTGSTWMLTGPDDTVERYTMNAAGLGVLDTIEARDGYVQNLQYNASGELATVTDSFGRTLKFTYQKGLLQTVTAPGGFLLTYGYTSSGVSPGVLDELTSVTYPTSPMAVEQYTYYPGYLLKSIIDPDGNTYVSYVYDAQDRAIQVYMGGNTAIDSTTVAYDDNDGSRTVTDPNGLTTVYKFASLQGAPKVVEIDREPSTGAPTTSKYTYDANGYVASYTDWNGNVTQYINDAHGQPLSVTVAAGTPVAQTTTTTYLPNFHLPALIVAPGLTTKFTYDAHGNPLTRTEVDTTTQTAPYSTKGETRVSTYTYGPYGEVLTVNGPRIDVADITKFTYNATGYLSTATDALGHVTRITSYNSRGLPLKEIDANGVTTTLTYDPMGRLTSQTVHTSSGNAVTKYGYDLAGLRISVTQPDGSVLTYTYDSAQRLTKISDPAGESITYTLDGMGNIIRQDTRNSSGAIVKTQSQVFNQLNERVQAFGATAAEVTTYTYDADGNAVSIADALDHTTLQSFDALNRLIQVTDPLSGVTKYGYDAAGNNVSVISPRGFVTSYVYDGFGDVIKTTSPDTGTTVSYFDAAGNSVKQIDARGIVTKRTFDALNRVSTETFPAAPGQNITYRYDSNASGNEGVGRLTGFTDQSGTTALKYDALGDVIVSSHTTGGKTATTTYAYNLAGSVTRIAYPTGLIVNYSHDKQGRINGVTTQANSKAGAVTLAKNVTYEPFGPLASLTFGNGLVLKYSFDGDYRITGITTQSATKMVQNLSVGYDAAGNILSITDKLAPAQSQTFTYDALSRLLTASGAYPAVTYTYDADSNRLTSKQGGVTQTYGYSTTSDELLSVTSGKSTQTFKYTTNGNMATARTGGQTTTYSYSALNRLAQVSLSGGSTATYAYDATGKRLSEKVGANVTRFNYDLNGNLIAQTNGSTGTATVQYVWLGNLPLAEIAKNGAIYFIHADQTNTPQKITNGSQAVVWDREQQPFGTTVSTKGSATNVLRAPGQIADAASGLNYNMMRDYNPALGRYIEADPSGLASGINLYVYVGQNPVGRSDPLGLCQDSNPLEPPTNTPFRSAADALYWGLGEIGKGTDWIGSQIKSPLDFVLIPSLFIPGAGEAEVGAESLFAAYMRQVETLDVATAENGAVFWSGAENEAVAEAFATENGRMTLVMTPGGKWLAENDPYGFLPEAQARQVWDRLSERFAEGASGNAVGFVEGASPTGTFTRVEWPVLSSPSNSRISNVITGGH